MQNLRCIVYMMNRLNAIHRIYVHKAAVRNGLYCGQLPILEFAMENDGCTQRELSEVLQVSAPSIATSVKRMQKAGLLEKVADKCDQRCNRITVTARGREFAHRCREDFDGIDEQMFSGFDDCECVQFHSYIKRLIDNLETGELEQESLSSLLDAEQHLHCIEDKGGHECD